MAPAVKSPKSGDSPLVSVTVTLGVIAVAMLLPASTAKAKDAFLAAATTELDVSAENRFTSVATPTCMVAAVVPAKAVVISAIHPSTIDPAGSADRSTYPVASSPSVKSASATVSVIFLTYLNLPSIFTPSYGVLVSQGKNPWLWN